jgi:hypothetical protein
MSDKMNKNNVSVVIATLGEVALHGTIESLNNGSLVPTEILICIPEENAANIAILNYSNVKILKTSIRGQVAQRVIGFQNAVCPYVLQLDDDVILDFLCLENLLSVLMSEPDLAVGPMLYNNLTKEYHSFLVPDDNDCVWFNKLFYFVANGRRGYQPGKISKSGINFGILEFPGTFYDVDWLCGGCVLHRKENLILHNYYPISGKAYAEDLFHSKLLRGNNIILVRSGEAKCYVDFSSSKGGGVQNFLRNFMKAVVPMKLFMRFNNGNLWHLYLILLFILIRHVLRYVCEKVNK